MSIFQHILKWFDKPEPQSKTPTLQQPDTAVTAEPEQPKEVDKPMDKNRLSKNFKLSEFTKSQTASRKKINNNPTPEHLENIKALVTNLIQPLRDHIDKPIVITSGYRSPSLNRAIGGASNSQHSKGEAVDIECFSMSNIDLANTIKDNFNFDQLILEFYNPAEGPNSGWVHVSFKADGTNRKQVLTALTDGKNTRYVHGIVTQ